MVTQVADQHRYVDVSSLSHADLEGLGNSVIGLELLELIDGPSEDEVYAAFDNCTSAQREPRIS